MSNSSFSVPGSSGVSGVPEVATVATPSKNIAETVKTTANVLSKWVPLICAGTAVAVSIIAIKEIKNVRKEVMLMKKEQLTAVSNTTNKTLTEKIERMDEQLKKITEYLTNQSKLKTETKPSKKSEKVINQAVKPKAQKVNIINEEPENTHEEPDEESEEEEEVEIEIEVTDDEKE
jgi:hypothetical protein